MAIQSGRELYLAALDCRVALFERLCDGAAQVWLTGTERAPFPEIEGEAAM